MNGHAPRVFREANQTSVVFMVFMTILSSGIYIPIWFLRRRRFLNDLKSSVKLDYRIFAGMIGIDVASIALALMEKELLSNIVGVIFGIIFILQCFTVRKILNEHYNSLFGDVSPITDGYTFLFGMFYIQYKLNRL